MFDIAELREVTSYDELELDTLGDQKTALFLIMSDTDDSFNFLISMCYTQLFNLLCEKADDVYGGRLPVHVRCLIDECANIGQIPKLEKLVATIRSREISACLVLQAQSQLKAIENGLSIVENPNPHGKSYDQWLGDQAKPSHRELLRTAIDNALAQKPADLDELLKLLRESGCEVSKRGKSYRLKLPGWGKVSRLDSLGDGYTLEDLLAVLAGQKEHTPRRKPVKQADPPKVNLLVDIQAKLQAGKGAGYARWAKVFNLKQMAQTVNYLTEHNLLEYAVLEEKAAAATDHHNELSAKIKVTEKRMAEIAVLRTHIINYAKTRDTYVAYRKAGYSKKFREEHEEEILLHQAAKNAFDDMGVKKLPKVKELQAEYARLLDEKKKTYAEYRRSREEMRELLAAKANVDRLLSMEAEHDTEREKDHGQR